MKKFSIGLVAILLGLSACGGSNESSVIDELNDGWTKMTQEEKATFCLSYHILKEELFRESAAKHVGEANVDKAVAWAKEKCD